MRSLLLADGSVTRERKKILMEQFKFYKKLYSSKNNNLFEHQNNYGKTVAPEDRKLLEQELDFEEIATSIKNLKPDKSPGCDGLDIAFYRMFWLKIKQPLKDAFDYAFSTKKLHISARRGVLTLIPKKDREPTLLKNWRPLTLLNTDYKILSKVLANRLQPILQYLISECQTGFLKNRNIMENIRRSLEVMEFCDRRRVEAILLSVDFEKCFDSIEYRAIEGSLRFFQFGENFIQWVMLLFTDFQLSAQNAGFLTPWWVKTRGCHQGCCYSPFQFLLCGEIFTLYINKQLEDGGIRMGEFLNLLSQFADDTDLYLKYDIEVINRASDALTYMESQMGLKVNYDNSSMYRIGSLKNTNAKLYTQKKFSWTNEPIVILGVTIAHEREMRLKLNYEPLLTKTLSTLKL